MKASEKGPQRDLLKINLLVHKGEQIKLETRLLKWILSSGRYILIMVEIVTISALVYRYKLDADLAAIQEQISKQIPYIQSLSADELAIKQMQFQLSGIKQLKGTQISYAETLVEIAKMTPKSIKLTNIALDKTHSFPKTILTINGQTPSNLELSAYIRALKANPLFAEITLTNISFEGLTTFTITGSLSGKGTSS